MRTLVWFRGKDLRIARHAPLADAATRGEVLPLFVIDPYFFSPERARRWPHRIQFLLRSLQEVAERLAARGSGLIVVQGRSVDVVPRLAERLRADRVVAQRWVEPFARERDRRVEQVLGDRLELFEGETLLPPGTLRNGSGGPYAVFTHFARAFQREAAFPQKPAPLPRRLPALPGDLDCEQIPIPTCEALGLTPNPKLQLGGEKRARERLRDFMKKINEYADARDRMDMAGTSRLSADLHFGTLSVREVWDVASAAPPGRGRDTFLNELLWREFAHSTLWDRPQLLEHPFRPGFEGFPYQADEAGWRAWVQGSTGYPVVDAAARQLLAEGYVHNRARMISASFLTKHLLIDYRRGEAHYLAYLTDGDWANNNAGWQWSAGCGCDAQPYFRVFNPVTQGKKFDPSGDYVRRWVPELARMPERYIHNPFDASERVLDLAGVRLGENYPRPIVDHKFARERFLALAAQHLKS